MGSKKWSKQEDDVMREMCGKVLYREIQKILPHRTHDAIKLRAQALGLKSNKKLARKLSYNEEYFATPDNENCYWAGVIAGDGCLLSHTPQVNIAVSSRDIIILEELVKHIGYTGQIKQSGIYRKFPLSLVAICHAYKWHEDLYTHWNITPRKTYTLQPPNITKDNLVYSYICGLFDSDGCFTYSNKKPTVSFCGTESLMVWIKQQIDKLVPITKKDVSVYKCAYARCYSVRWKGKRALDIRNALRDVTQLPFYLPRKWNDDAYWEYRNSKGPPKGVGLVKNYKSISATNM